MCCNESEICRKQIEIKLKITVVFESNKFIKRATPIAYFEYS